LFIGFASLAKASTLTDLEESIQGKFDVMFWPGGGGGSIGISQGSGGNGNINGDGGNI